MLIYFRWVIVFEVDLSTEIYLLLCILELLEQNVDGFLCLDEEVFRLSLTKLQNILKRYANYVTTYRVVKANDVNDFIT